MLNPIRQRMDDKDNPPTKSELDEFRRAIDTQKPEYFAREMSTSAKEHGSVSAEIDGKTGFSTRQLCDQFCMAHDDNKTIKAASPDEPNFAPIKLDG
ncbi:MAG: hypothetical protein AAF988_04755 [Pseudomonadota bacterium]